MRISWAETSVEIASLRFIAAATVARVSPGPSLAMTSSFSVIHASRRSAFRSNFRASCSTRSSLMSLFRIAISRLCSTLSRADQAALTSEISTPLGGWYTGRALENSLVWIENKCASKSPFSTNFGGFSTVRYSLNCTCRSCTPATVFGNVVSWRRSMVSLIHTSKVSAITSYFSCIRSTSNKKLTKLAMRCRSVSATRMDEKYW
mmetsp:Transcript_13141/g.39559  ORF Transcript_13141/g.39559 Transcript_13141/m.39559 type:complete len:205 (+) Transcript_13141:362-976(+)